MPCNRVIIARLLALVSNLALSVIVGSFCFLNLIDDRTAGLAIAFVNFFCGLAVVLVEWREGEENAVVNV